jgi:predicted Zn-dependent protease
MADTTSSALEQEAHDQLHAELIAAFGWETEAWVHDRLARVMDRLNAVRAAHSPPLHAHSLAIPAMTAFTTPTSNIYVSRQLMERMSSDEMVAFVLSHEIAHHDLGHLTLFKGWLRALPRGIAGSLTAAVFREFEDELLGPEREEAADRFAVDLCVKAGYEGARCIHAFDLLEQEHLNRGDIDGVYGPENLLDPTDPKHGGAAYAVQRWLWVRTHRYLPLHERRARAMAYHESCTTHGRTTHVRARRGE